MKIRSRKLEMKGTQQITEIDEKRQTSTKPPRKLFEDLYNKSIELGLKPEDFHYLTGIQEIQESAKEPGYCGLLFKILCIILITPVFVFVTEWPISNTHALVLWFQWYNTDPFKEPCFVYVPEGLTEAVNPPMNCDFCKNVDKVDRVQNISSDEFERVYAYSGRPVIITDGTKNWTASSVFSFNFMKEIFSPGSEALEKVERDCQFFPYKTDFKSLGKVFEMSEERASMKEESSPWYIGWSNCDYSAANVLRKHYKRPYFLPELSESSKTDWIFMGSPGYGAQLHIDNVDNPSWQAQITGRKRWVLEPPQDCYFKCPSHFEVVVNEGEIIVLDTNRWYHSTLNVGETISITIGSEYD